MCLGEDGAMRPRVKIADVVRVSGVSRATVDRVLNNRSGVKEATRNQVVLALETLGYAPDALSALKKIRPHDIRVFLLDGTNPFFAEIRAGFSLALTSAEALGVATSYTNFDPYEPGTLAKALSEKDDMTAAIVAVGAETEQTVQAVNSLQDRGIPVVTVISDMRSSKRAAHVGQNNFAAGETAGRLMSNMVPSGAGKIGVLVGHADFKHLSERQSGFQTALKKLRSDLQIVYTKPYGGTDAESRAIVNGLFDENPDLKGVYLSGGGQPKLIKALARNRNPSHTIIGHELSPISRTALEQGTFQALVAHDMAHVARMAIDAAMALTNARDVAPLKDISLCCSINVYVPENLPNG